MIYYHKVYILVLYQGTEIDTEYYEKHILRWDEYINKK